MTDIIRHSLAAIAIGALLLLCSSCWGTHVDPEFLEKESPGLQVKGETVFTYNANTCQMAFNRQKKEFRVCTDTMSDYYVLTLNEVPTATGDRVKGDLVWTSVNDVISRTGVSFVVKKAERNQMMWLWSRKENIGVVIQVLN